MVLFQGIEKLYHLRTREKEREFLLVGLLENISQLSGAVLLFCAIYYYFHFKKIKKERKLTSVELTVYILTQLGIFLWAGSNFILFLDRI